jgi:16S rRNA (guanine966-N2)-methyltransferase
MRIIAGTLGGRLFNAPHGHRTHPMSDKMRGALFNMLGDIEGLTVLDAFAGSGALAFEAVSRGAKTVTAIEQDRNAQRAITENIAALKISNQIALIKASAAAWLRTTDTVFDLVLLDPPYDALQYALLDELVERAHQSGNVVLSWPGKQDPPQFDGWSIQTSKQYGDGSLHFYARQV